MILLIDTAQETGTVSLAREGKILWEEENRMAKEHAGWLHPAIGGLLAQAKLTVRDLVAVSVMAGPGSYTGLRVGMAAAKGFCYALKIPLITQNTLRIMAESMIPVAMEKRALICPMIDARRDEVFTALYQMETIKSNPSSVIDKMDLQELLPPRALILDKNAFEMYLSKNPIVFFGSGAGKWKIISPSLQAMFEPQQNMNQAFARASQLDFENGNQADLVYAEPVYLKEFFSY